MGTFDEFRPDPVAEALANLHQTAALPILDPDDPKMGKRRMQRVWDGGKDRRVAATLLRSMYDHNWHEQLQAELKKRFRAENFERLRLMSDISQNPMRWVVRKLAAPYRKSPIRSLLNQAETPELLERYVQTSDIDLTMLEASRLTVLYREALVGPVVEIIEGVKVIKWRVITPDMFEVVTKEGDPTVVTELMYLDKAMDEQGVEQNRYIYWSDTSHWVYDENWQMLPPRDGDLFNVEGVNPYGKIPFVALHGCHAVSRFWHPEESNGLRMATLNNGVQMTDLWHALKNSAFKQLAISGDLDSIDPNLLLDPSQVLDLGREGGAEVLDFQPNLTAILDVVQQSIGAVSWMHGIRPQAYRGTQTATSGYQIEVENYDLTEEHDELRRLFERYEVQMHHLAGVVAARHSIPFAVGLMRLEWQHIGPRQNPQEIATYWEGLVAANLSTRKRALMNIHSLTDEQATEELLAIATEQQALSMIPMAPMIPMDEDTDEEIEAEPVEDPEIEDETDA